MATAASAVDGAARSEQKDDHVERMRLVRSLPVGAPVPDRERFCRSWHAMSRSPELLYCSDAVWRCVDETISTCDL